MPESFDGRHIGLPRFTEVHRIGSGGFTTVYRAYDPETERLVALKVFNVGDLSQQSAQSYWRELNALRALNTHPNIVTLYEQISTTDGSPALVLELCRESLAQRLATLGRLRVAETLSIGVKIAGALETAHRAGIFHRDVKPQNILVAMDDEPALADFGIAQPRRKDEAISGAFGLTAVHSAPELLQGRGATPSSDVYSLASTLYQLLAGTAPFAGHTGETPGPMLNRILHEPPPPLSAPGVPTELSTTLAAALAKNPRHRTQTAEQFAEQLRVIEIATGLEPTTYTVLDRRNTDPVGGAAGRGSAPDVDLVEEADEVTQTIRVVDAAASSSTREHADPSPRRGTVGSAPTHWAHAASPEHNAGHLARAAPFWINEADDAAEHASWYRSIPVDTTAEIEASVAPALAPPVDAPSPERAPRDASKWYHASSGDEAPRTLSNAATPRAAPPDYSALLAPIAPNRHEVHDFSSGTVPLSRFQTAAHTPTRRSHGVLITVTLVGVAAWVAAIVLFIQHH